MKYSEVNQILEGNEVLGYEEYYEQLNLMKELSDVLEKNREERNCIDFDIPDIGMIQDKNGKLEKIIESKNGVSGRIIENFMLATNTVVAGHYSWIPFIYRVHEAPNPEAVKNVIKILRTSGFRIPKCNNIDEITIKTNAGETKIIEIDGIPCKNYCVIGTITRYRGVEIKVKNE